MPEPNYIRCKKCNRILAEKRDGAIIFENHKIVAPLINWIFCKGDPHNPCNTVNYLEPEKLEMRKF